MKSHNKALNKRRISGFTVDFVVGNRNIIMFRLLNFNFKEEHYKHSMLSKTFSSLMKKRYKDKKAVLQI